jgi:hypothetical protein
MAQVPGLVPNAVRDWIDVDSLGRLEDIGRYSLLEDPKKDPKKHAALARVTYADGGVSWLVLLKASLTGDEPRDILQYATINPVFPQDPVSDQVFDDAQWESYRMLGQHVAQAVIR